MTDHPVLTSHPHDRLSRLADIMTAALDRVPGAGDVRAIVMLHDAENGCVHPHNYPEPVDGRNGLMFLHAALHLAEMGRALGVKVELLVNGKKGPRGSASVWLGLGALTAWAAVFPVAMFSRWSFLSPWVTACQAAGSALITAAGAADRHWPVYVAGAACAAGTGRFGVLAVRARHEITVHGGETGAGHG